MTALVGSSFSHLAELCYVPVKREALAVADALNKSRYLVLGCNDLIVAVDHKALLILFGDRSLDAISNFRLWNQGKHAALSIQDGPHPGSEGQDPRLHLVPHHSQPTKTHTSRMTSWPWTATLSPASQKASSHNQIHKRPTFPTRMTPSWHTSHPPSAP